MHPEGVRVCVQKGCHVHHDEEHAHDIHEHGNHNHDHDDHNIDDEVVPVMVLVNIPQPLQ